MFRALGPEIQKRPHAGLESAYTQNMDVEKIINSVVARFIGTKHERDVKSLNPVVEAINALEPEMKKLSDAELSAMTPKLKISDGGLALREP